MANDTDQHTPAPWLHSIAGCNHWIVDKCGRYIAYIGGRDSIFTKTPGTPHMANARLIAAAPDLLKACMAMIDEYETSREYQRFEIREVYRAAIAKATKEVKTGSIK